MAKIRIVSNMNSHKNKKGKIKTKRLSHILGKDAVYESISIDDVPRIVDKCWSEDVDVVCLNSGDGGIHVMLEAFIDGYERHAKSEEHKVKELPIFVPFPGGTVNFSAVNLNLKYRIYGIVEQLAEHVWPLAREAIPTVTRRLLELDLVDGMGRRSKRRGFIFVDAAGMDFFRLYDQRYNTSRAGYRHKSPRWYDYFRVLGQCIVGVPLGIGPGKDVLKGYEGTVKLDGKVISAKRHTMFSVASADIRVITLNVHYGVDSGDQLSVFGGDFTAGEFVSHLPTLYDIKRKVDLPTIKNYYARKVEIEYPGNRDFIMDGERYYAKKITLTKGPELRFIDAGYLQRNGKSLSGRVKL